MYEVGQNGEIRKVVAKRRHAARLAMVLRAAGRRKEKPARLRAVSTAASVTWSPLHLSHRGSREPCLDGVRPRLAAGDATAPSRPHVRGMMLSDRCGDFFYKHLGPWSLKTSLCCWPRPPAAPWELKKFKKIGISKMAVDTFGTNADCGESYERAGIQLHHLKGTMEEYRMGIYFGAPSCRRVAYVSGEDHSPTAGYRSD